MTDIQFKRGSTLPIYQITLYRPDNPQLLFPWPGGGPAGRPVQTLRGNRDRRGSGDPRRDRRPLPVSREVATTCRATGATAEIIVTFGTTVPS